MDTKKERVIYYDILNIFACFSVIWLHCNGIVHKYSSDGNAWATSLIVETIAYWAVPVFIMLSGATLMNYRKKYDTKTFFKKRFLKTVIPFIIWSIIVFLWKYFTHKIQIEEISIKSIVNIFILNKEEPIYYFFWIIFSVYLSMPVLSLLTEDKHRKTLWYIVILSAIFNSLPKLLSLIGIEWNSNLTFPIAGGYIMYVILGYLISTQDIKKKYRIIIYLLGIAVAFLRYFTTYCLSRRDGFVNTSFWGYCFFTGLFLSLAVFVFVKYLNISKIEKNEKIVKIISKISASSFGIYLIHQIIIYYQVRLLSLSVRSWEWRTIGAVSTYCISLFIVYLLKKIPILKKIVP